MAARLGFGAEEVWEVEAAMEVKDEKTRVLKRNWRMMGKEK